MFVLENNIWNGCSLIEGCAGSVPQTNIKQNANLWHDPETKRCSELSLLIQMTSYLHRFSSSHQHRHIREWCPRTAGRVRHWRRESLGTAQRTWVWCDSSSESSPGSFLQGELHCCQDPNKPPDDVCSSGDHRVLLQQDAQRGRHGCSGHSKVRS